VSGLICASLALASPVEAKPEFVVKFGTVAPDGTPWAKQLKRLKKRVEKQSKGRIKFKLFLGGVLGGEVEMVRAVRRGRLQGWGGSTAALAEGARIPQLQLLELPFLFRNLKEADHILDKVVRDDFVKILARKKFYLSFWHENGWRNFAAKKKQIRKIADLRGMKMRSQESPVHLAMYKAIGAQAESIPVPEVLGALKTGMVDGFDNTPLFTSATGWYEGIKYYTISQHIYQPAVIMYSKRFMDKLPKDLRKILVGDERKETIEGRKSVRGMRDALLKHFRNQGIKVYTLTDAERKPFMQKCKVVHKQFAGKVGRQLLAKVQKALKKYRGK
jgi:tripartite ATP-independent transporter DctP family solute receptor